MLYLHSISMIHLHLQHRFFSIKCPNVYEVQLFGLLLMTYRNLFATSTIFEHVKNPHRILTFEVQVK